MRRPGAWIPGLVALAAAAPMLASAISVLIQRPVIYFDGDQAVDEMALIRAGHLAQLVGNYSRVGWEHPGPAWFYALAVIYEPLGGESWAFVVATLIFQAVVALLILYVCWRIAGLPLVAAGSVLLLVYMALMGDQLFRNVWPPFAVILPMLLLLLLAALGAAGSNPALAAALVAGSFEAQTHVGTAPTVAVVVATAIVLRVVMERKATSQPRWSVRAPERWDRPLAIAALALLVAMWIPPLIDEATGHPGNLSVLFTFFTTHGSQRGFHAAVSALGRFVDVFEFPKLTSFGDADVSTPSNGYIAAAAAFAAVCGALAVAGARVKDRFVLAIGVILLAAMGAITLSIRDVFGVVYDYLLLWVTTLPVAFLLGCVALAVRRPPDLRARVPARVRVPLALVGALVLVALGAGQAVAFVALPPDPLAVQHTDRLSSAAVSAVSADPGQPVLIEPTRIATWTVAAGVGLQLVKHGHPIRVESQWTFMFGSQARVTGDERFAITFLTTEDAAGYEQAHPDATVIASSDVFVLLLRKIR